MKKIFIFLLFCLIPLASAQAQEKMPDQPVYIPDEFFKAKVLRIEDVTDDSAIVSQKVLVKILNGPEKGSTVEAQNGGGVELAPEERIEVGDTIVIMKTHDVGLSGYFVRDRYRLPALEIFAGLFFVLVVLFSGRKGLFSIAGLCVTILILALYIIPKILSGDDPLITGFIGAVAIAVLAIYTGHGINIRTTIALLSTLATLCITIALAILAVHASHLFGAGTEEAFYLQIGAFETLNLRGLLLAGIILGTLGVLDDITTSQTAAVAEIRRANPSLKGRELYMRGIRVGTEHIASLVNTLVLAYAGTSLPLLLLFTANDTRPLWIIFNSELVAEEIIRTIIGSISLTLAVPISTTLAVLLLHRFEKYDHSTEGHSHVH